MEKGVTPEETLSWEEYLKESFSLPERGLGAVFAADPGLHRGFRV